MKRLFMLRDNKSQPHRTSNGEVVYFETRSTAKYTRNKLDKVYYVTEGPDHIGPHGKHPKQRSDRRRATANPYIHVKEE
jgi:hypothetical protein